MTGMLSVPLARRSTATRARARPPKAPALRRSAERHLCAQTRMARTAEGSMSNSMKRGIFLASIALSVTLIAVGLLRGDPARVFANAVVVCLSCIGIQ